MLASAHAVAATLDQAENVRKSIAVAHQPHHGPDGSQGDHAHAMHT
jgi:hypothetical protein